MKHNRPFNSKVILNITISSAITENVQFVKIQDIVSLVNMPEKVSRSARNTAFCLSTTRWRAITDSHCSFWVTPAERGLTALIPRSRQTGSFSCKVICSHNCCGRFDIFTVICDVRQPPRDTNVGCYFNHAGWELADNDPL